MNTATINQIKGIYNWSNTNFHGNRKYVGNLTVAEYKAIVSKKNERELLRVTNSTPAESNVQKVRRLLSQSLKAINGNYLKVLIEGKTGIYYAHPVHGHSDYNKSRVFDKTPETIRLMNLFNSIIDRHISCTR